MWGVCVVCECAHRRLSLVPKGEVRASVSLTLFHSAPAHVYAKKMDLKYFIIRTEGLHLYRAFLRLVRAAPPHARRELI